VGKVVAYSPNKQARRNEKQRNEKQRKDTGAAAPLAEQQGEAYFPVWTPVFSFEDCRWSDEATAQTIQRDMMRARGLWHLHIRCHRQQSRQQLHTHVYDGGGRNDKLASLQELCIDRLVDDALASGEEEPALPEMNVPPGWWPLAGDAHGEHLLDQFAANGGQRVPSEIWHYDGETRTLYTPLRAAYQQPKDYYNAAYAMLALTLFSDDGLAALAMWCRLCIETVMPFRPGAYVITDGRKDYPYHRARLHRELAQLSDRVVWEKLTEVEAYFK
jgi:hypothetical protein